MTISFKLKAVISVYVVLILAMFSATYLATQKQADDGLLINLAGRQRMLSQKMSKELHHFMYVSAKKGSPDQAAQAQTRETMEVFDMTLQALTNGGRAPLSLNLSNTEYRQCPPAKGEIVAQLEIVSNGWKSLRAGIEKSLTGESTEENNKFVHAENVIVLKEMNKAVGMMQSKSERNIRTLLTTQLVIVVVAIGFMVWTMMLVAGILKRIISMKEFCKLFGQGDLRARSQVMGSDELGEMGHSLDVMADDLQKIIADMGNDASNLDGTSAELLQISNQVSADCENSSGRANSVAAATEEMSSNMISVAAAVEESL